MTRNLPLALVAAATLLTPALVPAAPASAASFSACSGGYNPDGSAGSFYGQIRAKRITCPAARTVVRRWVRAHADGTGNPTATSRVLGYTCRGRAVTRGHDTEGLSVLCVDGRRAVAFFGHP